MKKMNILIVEENKIISSMLVKLLKKYGIRIDVARDGFQAVCAMKKYQYYIAIINSRVKETSGIFIANQLRRESPNANIFIISEKELTDLDRNRSLEKRFFVFEKPIDFKKVAAGVEKIHKKVFKSLDITDSLQDQSP